MMFLVVILATFCGVSHAGIWSNSAQNSAQYLPQSGGKDLWSNAGATNSWSVPSYAPQMKYEGPLAYSPGYDKSGAPLPVQDTPEVAQAKALQLAEIAKAGGDVHPSYGPDKSIYDNEDPIAAKKYHEAAVEHAKAEIANALYHQYELISKYGPPAPYYGPQAEPKGYKINGAPLPVEDTPEVAHKKAKALAALAKAGGAIEPAVWTAEQADPWAAEQGHGTGGQANPWAGAGQSNPWAGARQSNPWAGAGQSNPWAGSGAQSNPWAGSAQSNSWPSSGAQLNPWAGAGSSKPWP